MLQNTRPVAACRVCTVGGAPGFPKQGELHMFDHKWRGALVLGVLVALAISSQVLAADKPKGKPGAGAPGAEAAGAGDKPYQDWKKVTKEAEGQKGLLTLDKKRETLYLELKPDQLHKPVLGIFSSGKGIGSNFLLGGLPLGD